MLVVLFSSLTSTLFISLICYLGLASVGHRFFIHQFYVSKLLQLFEYGQQGMDKIQQKIQMKRKYDKLEKKKLTPPISSMEKKQSPLNNGCSFNRSTSVQSLDSDYNTDISFDSAFDSNESESDLEEIPESFRSNHSMSLKLNETCNELNLATVMEFASLGLHAIVDDVVTKRFAAEELKTWNLLTRTDTICISKSFRLTCIWLVGFLFRYMFLFPIRLTIYMISLPWLVLVTAIIGLLPESDMKRTLYYYMSIMCFRMASRSFSMVITYHDKENKAKPGGICVANHTSPIDVVVLHCDNSYALVGQRHNGMLGLIQRSLARATHHIWFDRFQINDRQAVSKRLREHTEDGKKLPILVFPEGTCINNSAVMMFKKGSFEIGATIYPVAIKYDARFGDPFWNSSKYGYVRYLLMMMTSWAIVCDVWYLPPMTRRDGESAIDFANRVKSKIASRGGLVDLEWDGQLKRLPVKPELREQQQWKFSQTLQYIKTGQTNNKINKDANENFIYNTDNINFVQSTPMFQLSDDKKVM